jgi:hypothetical protein
LCNLFPTCFVAIRKKIAFNDWKGVEEYEGVPFHRIRYYKLNGAVIWDREKRINLLTGFNDRLVGQNNKSSLLFSRPSKEELKYPFREQIPYYGYNKESMSWETISSTSHPLCSD